MPDLTFYSFASVWHVDAPRAAVFDVLADTETYAAWWPEIKDVERVDEDVANIRARSFLPYDLRFSLRRAREDRDLGVLEAEMRGDLEGFSRFTLNPEGDGTHILFEEQVHTRRAILDRLALVARPAFKANHTVMMRNGERGLRTYLAGYMRGRTEPPTASA